MDYALLGEKLPYTISPRIHNLFGREYGIIELPTVDDAKVYLDSKSFHGLNVTMPYKISIMDHLDFIDFNAKELGAINTIVNRHDMLYGYNTDYLGLQYSLQRAGITLTSKDILILGSGGAAKTARYVSLVKGANHVDIVSRTGELNYVNVYDRTDPQIIINTTPIGTFPNTYAKVVDLSKFKHLEAVVDLIYNPLQTLLLDEAKRLGLKTCNGLAMLVEQARASENIFNFVDDIGFIGIEKTEEVINILCKEQSNLVLTGMAGVGKTTIGKILSDKLDMPFVDTDEVIEDRENMSIPEIFDSKGEEYFREVESEVIKEVLSKHRQVVSLGGGAILREDNRFYIRSNGIVCFIVRDLEKLPIKNRPLSKNIDNVKALFKEREKMYIEVSDFKVYNESIGNTVKEIMENYEKSISTKWR